MKKVALIESYILRMGLEPEKSYSIGRALDSLEKRKQRRNQLSYIYNIFLKYNMSHSANGP